jgi:hypothetical protein
MYSRATAVYTDFCHVLHVATVRFGADREEKSAFDTGTHVLIEHRCALHSMAPARANIL